MRKMIFLAMLLSLLPVTASGQQQKLQKRPYADQKLFHLGFTVGINMQDLILRQSGYVNENGEVWFSEIPGYTPGFSAGIIADLYLNSFMNLRIIPAASGKQGAGFKEQASGETFETAVRNNYITLPLQLKLRLSVSTITDPTC